MRNIYQVLGVEVKNYKPTNKPMKLELLSYITLDDGKIEVKVFSRNIPINNVSKAGITPTVLKNYKIEIRSKHQWQKDVSVVYTGDDERFIKKFIKEFSIGHLHLFSIKKLSKKRT